MVNLVLIFSTHAARFVSSAIISNIAGVKKYVNSSSGVFSSLIAEVSSESPRKATSLTCSCIFFFAMPCSRILANLYLCRVETMPKNHHMKAKPTGLYILELAMETEHVSCISMMLAVHLYSERVLKGINPIKWKNYINQIITKFIETKNTKRCVLVDGSSCTGDRSREQEWCRLTDVNNICQK